MSDVRQVLEEFRLHKVLKTSAQCTVFEASTPSSGEAVVLKLINPATAIAPIETASRFDAFASTLQDARPVGVPKILDFGLTPEHGAFLVLQPVEGEPAASLDDRSLARRVSIALEVLGIVEVIAAAGGVHGNLAPDNVLVTSYGIGDRVSLLGLGTCAYLLGVRPEVWPVGSTNWTVLPPELERGIAEQATDLWSIARLTCELLRLPLVDADSSHPRPVVPAVLGQLIGEPDILSEVLAGALVREIAQRTVEGATSAWISTRTGRVPSSRLPAVPDAALWDRTIHLPIPPMEPPEIPDADEEPAPTGYVTTRFQAAIASEAQNDGPSSSAPDVDDADDPFATTLRMPITEAMPVAPTGELVDRQPSSAALVDDPAGTVLAAPPPPPAPEPPPPVPEPVADRTARPAASGGPRPRWLPLVVIASVLGVAAVVAVGLRMVGSEVVAEPTPVPVATPTPVPRPTPVDEVRPVVHPLLQVAQEELLEGDVQAARETVGQLSDERIADTRAAMDDELHIEPLDEHEPILI